jgi:hypothetical protein
MGWFDKVTLAEKNRRIDELQKDIENLKYANDVYKKRLETEMANASFAIDWDAMNVFSIERVWEDGLPKTILGYIIEEPVTVCEGETTTKDVVREWNLYCSAEKHEELVKEFKEWVSSK